MKNRITALVSLVTLAACVTEPSVYTAAWKIGQNGAARETDITACEVESLSKVPRALTTNVTPVYRTPSNVQCTSYGYSTNCVDYGGQVYGGQAYTQDVNAGLRERVQWQCLARKGYTPITRPTCTVEQRKAGETARSSGKMPDPENVLCFTETGYVKSQ